MNEIEEKIWDFIDGNLSTAERQEIKVLIDSNEIYQQKYRDFLAFSQSLETMSLDEPSMAFSRNVMRKVQLIHVPLSEKARVNVRIIQFIGGFFVLSLALILAFTFSQINWSEKSSFVNPINLNFANLILSSTSKSNFIQFFLVIDLLIALLFFDKLLRLKRKAILFF